MPIKSYIALPHEGHEEDLENAIEEINGCEIIPAQNAELLIIVTDTKNESHDEKLYEKLLSIQYLKHLMLISGFNNI